MSEGGPASPRFRRAAHLVAEDARERSGGGTWAVAQHVGGPLLVVAAAGDPAVVTEGRLVPAEVEAAVEVPLALPDGTTFGALLGFGSDAGAAVPRAQLERLAEVLTTVLAVEWEAQTLARRAEAESRRAGRANWGLPKELGTLEWLHDGDARVLRWIERDLVVRASPAGPPLPA
ncbi:MAG TPA: hypothetical protein VHE80_08065, partial [Acidimicrobiales bacterium]|nr:hypothetical protein [Acidimicrobiales bacterium]